MKHNSIIPDETKKPLIGAFMKRRFYCQIQTSGYIRAFITIRQT